MSGEPRKQEAEPVREPASHTTAAPAAPAPPPPPGAPDAVFRLQRAAGNRATSRLLQSQPRAATVPTSGQGRELDTPIRREMEGRFEADFGDVRVHTGERAARAARSVSAKAYTFGSDIVFSEGRFAPHTSAGKHLLGHELSHVVQQRRGAAGASESKGLERSANTAAGRLTQGGPTISVAGAASVGVARAPEDEERATISRRAWKLLPEGLRSRVAPFVPVSEALEARLSPEAKRKAEEIVRSAESAKAAAVAQPQPAGPVASAQPKEGGGVDKATEDLRRQVEAQRQQALTTPPAPFAVMPTGLGIVPPQQVMTPQMEALTRKFSEATPEELTGMQSAFATRPEEVRQELGLTPGEFEAMKRTLDFSGGDRRYFLTRPPGVDDLARRVCGLGPNEPVTQAHFDQLQWRLEGRVAVDFMHQYDVDGPDYGAARQYLRSRSVIPERLQSPPDPNAPVMASNGRIVKQGEYAEYELARRVEGMSALTQSASAAFVYGATKLATNDDELAWQLAGLTGAIAGTVGSFGGGSGEPALAGVSAKPSYRVKPGRGIASGGAAHEPAPRPTSRQSTPPPAEHAPAKVPVEAVAEATPAQPAHGEGLIVEPSSGVELDPDWHGGEGPAFGERTEGQLQAGLNVRLTEGTGKRSGMYFGELNAAEMGQNKLRFAYDREQRHPLVVQYEVHPEPLDPATGRSLVERETDRSFTQDPSVGGQEHSAAGYLNSGMDKGHLAQREAFRGYGPAERAADSYATTVPMSPNLNRGSGSPWRAAETKTVEWSRSYGGVKVTVEPIYGNPNLRLSNGTPIPTAIRRQVTKLDGTRINEPLADVTFLNQ